MNEMCTTSAHTNSPALPPSADTHQRGHEDSDATDSNGQPTIKDGKRRIFHRQSIDDRINAATSVRRTPARRKRGERDATIIEKSSF